MNSDRDALKNLAAAIEETERDHPLPRCQHGNALKDGGGELLEPSCGCRAFINPLDHEQSK